MEVYKLLVNIKIVEKLKINNGADVSEEVKREAYCIW